MKFSPNTKLPANSMDKGDAPAVRQALAAAESRIRETGQWFFSVRTVRSGGCSLLCGNVGLKPDLHACLWPAVGRASARQHFRKAVVHTLCGERPTRSGNNIVLPPSAKRSIAIMTDCGPFCRRRKNGRSGQRRVSSSGRLYNI
jgi:hypothetical protein